MNDTIKTRIQAELETPEILPAPLTEAGAEKIADSVEELYGLLL